MYKIEKFLWFKLKYHPEDALKRKDECKAALEKRIDVFTRFLEEKRFNDIAIDGDQSDPMVKLLDSVVIFLEGGTDFDLEILDQELSEKAEEKMKMEEINKDNKELGEKSIGGEEVKKAEEEDNNADGTKNGADDANNDNDAKKEKNDNERKRKSYDEDSSSSDENEEEAPPPGLEVKKDKPKEEEENKDQETGKENGTKEAVGDGEDEEATKKDAEDEKDEKMEEEIESSEENNKVEDQQPKPRALHKTTSIFLRNLAPTITKQEVEAMCKRYPGFLRAAIADPQPERRWFRRGWITFERDEAGKLGMKNEDDEVEKFVQANTQELGKDKWLCPLSGKKFKGPDFVRKHIFNKHGEKVEEVKKEVQYYNNYLRDPKRPQLPENPKTGSRENRGGRGDVGSGRGPSDPPREATNYPIYDDYRDSRGYRERQYSHDRGGGYRSGGHRGGRPDQFNRGSRMENPYVGRPIITYRDLDAPRDFDEF